MSGEPKSQGWRQENEKTRSSCLGAGAAASRYYERALRECYELSTTPTLMLAPGPPQCLWPTIHPRRAPLRGGAAPVAIVFCLLFLNSTFPGFSFHQAQSLLSSLFPTGKLPWQSRWLHPGPYQREAPFLDSVASEASPFHQLQMHSSGWLLW